MRVGRRGSNATLNIVVFGLNPMSIRLQVAPPSVLRNRAPSSLWKYAPPATQMVLGSPGTLRMSRQYVWPFGLRGSSRALAQCSPWSVLLKRPARPMAKTSPGRFFFFQAEDGIRDKLVTGVRRVLFR